MAYVYYIPPPPLQQPAPERPSFFSPQRTGVWGPVLIFIGGASALMIAFFERNPFVIWPVIGSGVVLCSLGVYLARRHVKFWREQEQERQRAIWRNPRRQQQGDGGDAGGGTGSQQQPEFDVPLYVLEAPSRPLFRTTSNRATGSRYGSSSSPAAPPQPLVPHASDVSSYDNSSEYWCALAVPLHPDDVSGGHYLEWAAMTLVVQPHFKFQQPSSASTTTTAAAAAASPGAAGNGRVTPATSPFAAAAARASSSDMDAFGPDGAAAATLTRTGGSRRRRATNTSMGDATMDLPPLTAVSLTLVRTPSLGLRPARGVGTVSLGDRRGAPGGRSSLTGRMVGDLFSLFATVATGAAAIAAAAAAGGDGGLAKAPRPANPSTQPPPVEGVPVCSPLGAAEGYPAEGQGLVEGGTVRACEAGPSERGSSSQVSQVGGGGVDGASCSSSSSSSSGAALPRVDSGQRGDRAASSGRLTVGPAGEGKPSTAGGFQTAGDPAAPAAPAAAAAVGTAEGSVGAADSRQQQQQPNMATPHHPVPSGSPGNARQQPARSTDGVRGGAGSGSSSIGRDRGVSVERGLGRPEVAMSTSIPSSPRRANSRPVWR